MFARTEAQRRKNTALVNRRRILLEAWVEPKLRRVMVEAGRDSALEYTRGGLGRVQAIAIAEYRQEVKEILESLYERTSKSMASLVVDSAKGFDLPIETKELDQTLETLLDQFSAFALDQSKLISNTMTEEIIDTIEPLVAEGAGEREIGRAIRKHVEGIAPWQANRIARTETLMSSSWAQDQVVREMELPQMAKEWDSTRDSRTRKDHRRVEPVFMEEKFSVGGKPMRYPGDPSGGKENVIGCRCVVNYAPAEQMAELREEAEQREADIQEELDFDDDAFVEPDL